MMKKIIFLLIVVFSLAACTGRHDETMAWLDKQPAGITLWEMRKNQPAFVEINWDKPIVLEGGTKRYEITKIEGRHSLSSARFFLVFDGDNRYVGRAERK